MSFIDNNLVRLNILFYACGTLPYLADLTLGLGLVGLLYGVIFHRKPIWLTLVQFGFV